MKHRQYTFADMEISISRKPSRVSVKLEQINSIVDWQSLLELVQIVDRTDSVKGGVSAQRFIGQGQDAISSKPLQPIGSRT